MSGRLARALALDGNPLRRASDRAEAWIRAGLLAVFLAAGPVAALAAGGWSDQMRAAQSGAGAAPVHAVRAVLLQQARAAIVLDAPYGGGQVWVRARWESPGARARTGEVPAPAGSPAGSTVTVWLTASGRVTAPPPEPGQSTAVTGLVVMTMLAAVALALVAVLRFVQRFLNRQRLTAWEAAWSAIGPRWTGHKS
jgi:hypothetical protein